MIMCRKTNNGQRCQLEHGHFSEQCAFKELGSDTCYCGDYRSQHKPKCFCGCPGFRWGRPANAQELAHWEKYHAKRDTAPATKPQPCQHFNFKATVNVFRLTDIADESKVNGYTTEIRVNCAECGMPFEFAGVDAGMSQEKPMASPDAQELRAPIRPKGCKIMPAIPGFTMRAQ